MPEELAAPGVGCRGVSTGCPCLCVSLTTKSRVWAKGSGGWQLALVYGLVMGLALFAWWSRCSRCFMVGVDPVGGAIHPMIHLAISYWICASGESLLRYAMGIEVG